MTSFHPRDREEGWCAYCNWWTSDAHLGQLMVDGEHRAGCDRPECLGCQVDINKVLPS